MQHDTGYKYCLMNDSCTYKEVTALKCHSNTVKILSQSLQEHDINLKFLFVKKLRYSNFKYNYCIFLVVYVVGVSTLWTFFDWLDSYVPRQVVFSKAPIALSQPSLAVLLPWLPSSSRVILHFQLLLSQCNAQELLYKYTMQKPLVTMNNFIQFKTSKIYYETLTIYVPISIMSTRNVEVASTQPEFPESERWLAFVMVGKASIISLLFTSQQ